MVLTHAEVSQLVSFPIKMAKLCSRTFPAEKLSEKTPVRTCLPVKMAKLFSRTFPAGIVSPKHTLADISRRTCVRTTIIFGHTLLSLAFVYYSALSSGDLSAQLSPPPTPSAAINRNSRLLLSLLCTLYYLFRSTLHLALSTNLRQAGRMPHSKSKIAQMAVCGGILAWGRRTCRISAAHPVVLAVGYGTNDAV
jgi:hypothetical protein